MARNNATYIEKLTRQQGAAKMRKHSYQRCLHQLGFATLASAHGELLFRAG